MRRASTTQSHASVSADQGIVPVASGDPQRSPSCRPASNELRDVETRVLKLVVCATLNGRYPWWRGRSRSVARIGRAQRLAEPGGPQTAMVCPTGKPTNQRLRTVPGCFCPWVLVKDSRVIRPHLNPQSFRTRGGAKSLAQSQQQFRANRSRTFHFSFENRSEHLPQPSPIDCTFVAIQRLTTKQNPARYLKAGATEPVWG